SRIHAEQNHRWTQMNTDAERWTLVLPRFALGHCPVNGFSPWKSTALNGSYLCLSVSICGCIELLGLSVYNPRQWHTAVSIFSSATPETFPAGGPTKRPGVDQALDRTANRPRSPRVGTRQDTRRTRTSGSRRGCCEPGRFAVC